MMDRVRPPWSSENDVFTIKNKQVCYLIMPKTFSKYFFDIKFFSHDSLASM